MEENIIPYNSVRLRWGANDAYLTVMCQGIRVHVTVLLKDLPKASEESVGTLRKEFLDLRGRLDEDPDAIDELEEWMLLPCMSNVRQSMDPARRKEHSSLQSYFRPTTLLFSLEDVNGRLEATQRPDDAISTTSLTPRVSTSDQSVRLATEHGVPHFPASQIEIIRAPNVTDWEYDEIPKVVRTPEVQGQLYFKPAFNQSSFSRELDICMRVQSNDPLRELRVPTLAGIVQWEHEHMIGGLLIEYIPDANKLTQAADKASEADRLSWAQQIRQTLERLHSLDIVWGDVKPDNVSVDSEGKPWVIDFGGGYSPGWVEEDVQSTKTGDLQGLERLEEYLASGKPTCDAEEDVLAKEPVEHSKLEGGGANAVSQEECQVPEE